MKQQLSIVVIIKNRTAFPVQIEGKEVILRLFEHNLDQLIALHQPDREEWQLVVCDFASTDVDMQTYLTKKFQHTPSSFTFQLHTMTDKKFCKGKGLNAASKLAAYENIFFLDADMLITTRQIFDDAYRFIQDGKVYFPICMNYDNPQHSIAKPRPSGTGNVFISKKHLVMKPWPEYQKWGNEDTHFHKFFQSKKLAVRSNPQTFFHQWHPCTFDFKNRYY